VTETALDKKMRPKVTAMIADSRSGGRLTEFKARSHGAYDTSTLETPVTETSHKIMATPPQEVSSQLIGQADGAGDVIRVGDKQLIISGEAADESQYTPRPLDLVVLDGDEHRIIRVDTLYTGALVGAYIVFTRSG